MKFEALGETERGCGNVLSLDKQSLNGRGASSIEVAALFVDVSMSRARVAVK